MWKVRGEKTSKRIIATIVWFNLFIAVTLITAEVLVCSIPAEIFLYHELEYHLVDYHKRWRRYRSQHPTCYVIVGSSYASEIGELPNIYNLACAGTRVQEHKAVISKYCRQEDTIVYYLTMHDLLPGDSPPESLVTNRFSRSKMILSGLAERAVGLESVRGIFDQKKGRADSAPIEFRRKPRSRGDSAMRTEELESLVSIRPRIILVLAPVQLGDEYAVNLNAQFEEKVEELGLPYLNLSKRISDENFRDVVHLTEAGNQIVRDELMRYLKKHHRTPNKGSLSSIRIPIMNERYILEFIKDNS